MDSEILKLILELQRENILYKRAIADAIVMLTRRESYFNLDFHKHDIDLLFKEIRDLFISNQILS